MNGVKAAKKPQISSQTPDERYAWTAEATPQWMYGQNNQFVVM